MSFLLAYLFFGPIVAIPLGIMTMSWADMLVTGMLAQLGELVVIHYVLEGLDYPLLHRRALLEKFANAANKKVDDIRHNTEALENRFFQEFGHFGYYLSLVFFSFTLGVTWSAVIAFALRLRTSAAAVFITIGSALGFVFWYWAFEGSLYYVASDVLSIVAFTLSILLLFYGEIHEKHILRLALNAIGKRKKKKK
ncbi:hypothetical protein ACFLQ2_04810 [archaeon]